MLFRSNSPREYSADRVSGRTLVISTTNGTAALHACRAAREILVGAIVNRAAVAAAIRLLAATDERVHLVCAGTDGEPSAEDVLAAGAILDAAAADGPADVLDAAAAAARGMFRDLVAGQQGHVPGALGRAFAQSPGGANLIALGMSDDLATCAQIDTLEIVPRLDRECGCLRQEIGRAHV